jgi:hypothetical protein
MLGKSNGNQSPQFLFDRAVRNGDRRKILFALEVGAGPEMRQRDPASRLGEVVEKRSQFVLGQPVLNILQ